jgi:hypothetical protein
MMDVRRPVGGSIKIHLNFEIMPSYVFTTAAGDAVRRARDGMSSQEIAMEIQNCFQKGRYLERLSVILGQIE